MSWALSIILPNGSVPGPHTAPSPSSANRSTRNQFPNEGELYSRLLLLRRRGYPLWIPVPSQPIPEEFKKQGIRIGDVGILTTTGGFDYLFNTCLPHDDPANSAGLPEGFEPLNVDQGRMAQLQDIYLPGSHISSRCADIQVRFPQSQVKIPGVPDEFGAGMLFAPRASTGALLILPEGATSTDHQSLDEFRDHARIWARKWFHCANSSPESRGTKNLYLVTGCDKTRAWGVACFLDAPVGSVLMHFVPTAGEPPKYRFSRRDYTEVQSGSDKLGNRSGCVFTRGYKIAVRQRPVIRTKTSVKVTYFPELNPDVDDIFQRQNNVRSPSSWGRMLGYLGSGTSSDLVDGDLSDRDPHPFRAQVYHPLDDINDWILRQFPQVEIAMTHDEDLSAVMNEDEMEKMVCDMITFQDPVSLALKKVISVLLISMCLGQRSKKLICRFQWRAGKMFKTGMLSPA
ncbi:hypothetical protein F5890DRAFT_660182 [Lentinula detonsa]|uniref:Uncharacterized protein n=1 Tax=Lentinula detonsa TaxID=2804962 RepID=A0AA38Q5A8_9AGAR|nr:hypothetical protein F5890DRAFT_660182 [Lentinula detonsa]